MTHAYSAGGSSRTAAFAAIIGLHIGLYVVIVLGLVPRDLPVPWPERGPIPIIPVPEPEPKPVAPGDPGPSDGFAFTVEQPVVPIPEFDQAEKSIAATAMERPAHGEPSLTGAVEYVPASLRTRHSGMGALVASCYPAASRRNGEEGRVIASVKLGARASATSWRVHRTSGFPRLDAAIDCVVRRLEFLPARRDGQAVEAEVLLPIVFRLDGN
ncbi:MAG: energy transducer TonB [Gammaproteobacteria bacterium]